MDLPIDCTLGSDCFIQQYVDHDVSDQASDFRCSTLSYDTHQGTDFALRSLKDMRLGVNVLAAAGGTVRGTRNGMEDRLFRADDAARIGGRDCGNGVVVDHGDGWTTQYCHLKQGSVQVRTGDKVQTGTVLGQVGLSGRTQFPHMHMTVRKDADAIDPFDPDGVIQCDAPSDVTLWQDAPVYQPGGVIAVGFADAIPDFDAIKDGTAGALRLPGDAPALVVFGYAFGSKSGDQMQLRIDGPEGTVINETVSLDRTQAQLFRAVGKRRTTDVWATGTYLGTVILLRDRREVSRLQSTMRID
ncbi:MAG: M23 family metallopeptidase [Tateyamaria sp.]